MPASYTKILQHFSFSTCHDVVYLRPQKLLKSTSGFCFQAFTSPVVQQWVQYLPSNFSFYSYKMMTMMFCLYIFLRCL